MTFEHEITKHMTRIETRLVRFAEALGVDTTAMDTQWLSVDDAARVIYIATLSRSLLVILDQAKKCGASQRGKPYDLIHGGECVGTVVLS